MRILIVSEHYWPEVGGAEVMLRRLAVEWASSGNDVTIVTRRWSASTKPSETDGATVIHRLPVVRTRFVGTAHFYWQLQRWIRCHYRQFDVVYVSMLKHAAHASLRAGMRVGLPVVLRAEGAGETGDVHWQETARGGMRIRQRCQLAPVVVPSRVIDDEARDAGYLPSRVFFIPNGVPIPSRAWSIAEVSSYRQQLRLPDRPTVCFVGRLHPQKGVLDLIDAIADPVLNNKTQIQLLIVGDGPCREELQRHVNGLHRGDKVFFAGNVDDVDPFLRASNLFVLPSYQEGLSVSLLEAAALGMPLLASDIPANRNILSSAQLPLAAIRDPKQLAEAISQQLLLSETHRIDLASQRETVQSIYSLNAVSQAHLRLFEQLSKGFKQGHPATWKTRRN